MSIVSTHGRISNVADAFSIATAFRPLAMHTNFLSSRLKPHRGGSMVAGGATPGFKMIVEYHAPRALLSQRHDRSWRIGTCSKQTH